MTLRFTYGLAIDYLYGLAQTAVAGVVVNGAPMAPADGPAVELAAGMFVVGLDAPINEGARAVTATDLAPVLGASLQESYNVPCYIDVRQSAATQKTVRDLALSAFNPFLNALMADRSLGGLLAGGAAEVVNATATPSLVGTAAEPGQRHLLSFSVRCTDLQIS